MQMRTIESLGVTVSRLGFGAMRLPTQADGTVDYPAAEAIVDYLFAQGVNYFDTAYFYHNKQSEPFLRRALVERHPRDAYFIASKLPVFACRDEAHMRAVFQEQKQNLGVEVIDFYLMHALSKKSWEKACGMNARELGRELKESGQVRFLGFSFHDAVENFESILDDFPWDFCQIQLNYADWSQYKADVLYHALVERGIPIIVMEPVRGGGLSTLYPHMLEILKETSSDATPASLALRFCADLPQVDLILSGMSNMAQCEENIATFSPPQPLTDRDKDGLRRVVEALSAIPLVPCTKCEYCKDCPQSIPIPTILSGYNSHVARLNNWDLTDTYYLGTPEEKRASACTRCGFCESVCPQQIKIPDEIEKAHSAAMKLLGMVK